MHNSHNPPPPPRLPSNPTRPRPSPPGTLPAQHALPQTQAMAYAGLWWASERPSDPDPDDTRDYSIVAVSGAMYLMLSIAAADLWGCVALIFEGRSGDPAVDEFVWFTKRRTFGFALLATFLTLVGASIRVLFYSAFENVELVIGAATVLFIADVVRGSADYLGIPSADVFF